MSSAGPETGAEDVRLRVAQLAGLAPVTVAVLDVRRTSTLSEGEGMPQQTARRITALLAGEGFATAVDPGAVLAYATVTADELAEVIEQTRRSADLWGILAGIASGEPGESADSLFSRALDALAAARHHDGIPTRIDPGLFTRRRAVADSLASDEFHLVFQPIVHLPTHTTVGAEALLRWSHPVFGEQSPAQFIPWFETSGAIIEIGQWVLASALRVMAEWISQDGFGGPTFVSVNVSGVELLDPAYASRTVTACLSIGVDPNRLRLEIVESSVGGISDVGRENLAALRRAGVQIALDDFGVGSSNFERLMVLPADSLKIDRQFLLSGKEGAQVIAAILDLTTRSSLTAIVEGIETVDQEAWLIGQGCELGQGFLYSPGVLPDAFQAASLALSGVGNNG